MPDRFYTSEEVSELLKIDKRTVTRLIRNSKLKAYKIGKEWRIPYDALAEFLNANSNE